MADIPHDEKSDLLESYYAKIGWRVGPLASRDVRDSVREFWLSRAGGAAWLARRIRREIQVDVLDGVANLLADMGHDAIAPIREELGAGPTADQAEALGKALTWIEESRQ